MRPAAENTRSTPAVEAGAARYWLLLGHLSELWEAVLVVLPPVEQDDVSVLERHRQVLLELVHLGLRLVVGGRALLEDATQGYLR